MLYVSHVCFQVHTFYEAVGYMIGAQTDQAVQEHLIEKYMLLPNQVWDSIIQQATKVSPRNTCPPTGRKGYVQMPHSFGRSCPRVLCVT